MAGKSIGPIGGSAVNAGFVQLNPNRGAWIIHAVVGNNDRASDSVNTDDRQVTGVLARFRLQWLLARWPATGVSAAYVFVNSFVTIALLALLAGLTGSPFVFPSLGPTAYIFFFSPMSKAASPRDTILGARHSDYVRLLRL